jgi:hypothetical protein
LRILQERKGLAEPAAKAGSVVSPDDPAALLDRASLFRDRGVSLDTSIFASFSIEQTLRGSEAARPAERGASGRAAVVGPGLDFIDKNEESAYDYHPLQTVQPFAPYDSLLRLGLARAKSVSLTILDISPRVIEHIQPARERAAKNTGYVIQLPREVARPGPQDVVAYWNCVGDQVGTSVAPIPQARDLSRAEDASGAHPPGCGARLPAS